jgi:hypothetical protein
MRFEMPMSSDAALLTRVGLALDFLGASLLAIDLLPEHTYRAGEEKAREILRLARSPRALALELRRIVSTHEDQQARFQQRIGCSLVLLWFLSLMLGIFWLARQNEIHGPLPQRVQLIALFLQTKQSIGEDLILFLGLIACIGAGIIHLVLKETSPARAVVVFWRITQLSLFVVGVVLLVDVAVIVVVMTVLYYGVIYSIAFLLALVGAPFRIGYAVKERFNLASGIRITGFLFLAGGFLFQLFATFV